MGVSSRSRDSLHRAEVLVAAGVRGLSEPMAPFFPPRVAVSGIKEKVEAQVVQGNTFELIVHADGLALIDVVRQVTDYTWAQRRELCTSILWEGPRVRTPSVVPVLCLLSTI